jgi:hypothetical protein
MPHSVLVVPVPELEPVVGPRLRRISPEYVVEGPHATLAHVTLLGPFAELSDLDPGLLAELESFVADVTPFTFALTRICQFPQGQVYLAPDPAAPFRHLTHALHRRFPEYPPYGGAFGDVVPHLSVPLPPDEPVEVLREQLEGHLPIAARAGEAELWWFETDRCRTVETFAFGTTAA